MKAGLLSIFLVWFLPCAGQQTFQRQQKESAENFVKRIFPEFSEQLRHPVVEGFWGDTTTGKKIIFFYSPLEYESEFTKAILLEPVSKLKYQSNMMEHEFGIGVAPSISGIQTVFFMDYFGDSRRELVVVELGMMRCEVEFYEYNSETGLDDTIWTMASCDLCGYSIFSQNKKTGEVEEIEREEEIRSPNCDAAEVKAILQARKEE